MLFSTVYPAPSASSLAHHCIQSPVILLGSPERNEAAVVGGQCQGRVANRKLRVLEIILALIGLSAAEQSQSPKVHRLFPCYEKSAGAERCRPCNGDPEFLRRRFRRCANAEIGSAFRHSRSLSELGVGEISRKWCGALVVEMTSAVKCE